MTSKVEHSSFSLYVKATSGIESLDFMYSVIASVSVALTCLTPSQSPVSTSSLPGTGHVRNTMNLDGFDLHSVYCVLGLYKGSQGWVDT